MFFVIIKDSALIYIGSGALPCNMLLIRIIENNKIDAYF